MNSQKIDAKDLNSILKKTVGAIEESQDAIFDIAENARKECKLLKEQMEILQIKVKTLIQEIEKMEILEKNSRSKLLEVSRDFSRFSEDDIRRAYEKANDTQIKLAMKRQEETDLIRTRTDLELRFRNTLGILKKAEDLVSKIGVAMEFLTGNLVDFTSTLEDIQQRAVIGKRIIQAQEEERQRVARDIHDGPAQSLANLIIKSEICEKLIDIDRTRAKEEIQDLRRFLRDGIKEIRKIIYNLRPMSLEDLGFVPTVQRFVDDFQDETGIQVDFIILSKMPMEDPIKNLAIFRIIQESLNNIRKHAEASLVKIKLEMTPKNILLSIVDNGVGFDVSETAFKPKKEGGFGLFSIRERVELLNGSFEIKSEINNGTKILVNISNVE
ncbi:sensor histidine kinase [Alkaliphilus hydrothermalis]|uniref:histidine kinase n=1 Tax=Alkaliphilus hydrothermalis TaxID=1482730 RepID=A0ABS2NPG4_9FIRM|nr:sensor histidine kinase [Alkaliphilus hydrothermalis]MBM7614838.1 two-component system sensor histidine kinase DegS [Alkaliphilus hydrothermalis]